MSGTFVFGASGFIGQHMAREAGSNTLSFVTRRPCKHTVGGRWLEADMLRPSSLAEILTPGSSVINLAYSASAPAGINIQMAENLARACVEAKVSRLVHCSTAVVVGDNAAPVVDENSDCFPSTRYERDKRDIEKLFMGASPDFEVYILRPTAVIGPGGQNLKKLLSEIFAGNDAFNFIRSSIHSTRKLNLVPVKDVVRALLHLCQGYSAPPGIYLCSADDDPDNRYDRVEEIIRATLERERRARPFRLSAGILNLLLSATRTGSGKFPNRHYSADKLYGTGFQRTVKLSDAIREFVLSEVHR